MTKADRERTAADVRYANARAAARALPADADDRARDDVTAELFEAHRHIARQAEKAGTAAMKSEDA